MRLIHFFSFIQIVASLSINGSKTLRIGLTVAFSEQETYYATAINSLYLRAQQLNNNLELIDDDTKVELYHIENNIQRPKILMAGVEFIKSDVLAIIGTGWSSLTDLLLLVTRNSGLMVCDGGSTSPMLSNKVKYPNFFRTVPQDADQADVIVGFIKSNGWKKIGIIYSNEPYGIGLATQTEKISKSTGIQVLSKISYQPYSDIQSYLVSLKRMKEADVRIILVYCLQQSLFQSFIELGISIGLYGDGYVWMGGDMVGAISIPTSLLDGSIAFFPVEAQGPEAELFANYYTANRLSTTYQYRNYSQDMSMQGYQYFYTNCLDVLLMGFHALLKSNPSFTVDDLLNRKLNRLLRIPESFNFPDYISNTGRIQLNQFGDRKGDYYVYNFQDSRKVLVGKWESGKYVKYMDILYSGKSTEIPSDGIIPEKVAFYISYMDTFSMITLLVFLGFWFIILRLMFRDLSNLYAGKMTDMVRLIQLTSILLFSFKSVTLTGIPTITGCTIDNVIPSFCCSLFFSLCIASHTPTNNHQVIKPSAFLNSWSTVQKAVPWIVPTFAILLYWNVNDPPVPATSQAGYQSYVWVCASRSKSLSDIMHSLLFVYNALLLLISGLRIIKTFQRTRGQSVIDLSIICVLNTPIIAAITFYTHEDVYLNISSYLKSYYVTIACMLEVLIMHLAVLHFNKVNNDKSANKNLEMEKIKDNFRTGTSNYILSLNVTLYISKINKKPLNGIMVYINDPQSYKSIFIQPQLYILQFHSTTALYLYKENNGKLESNGIVWESQNLKTFESEVIDSLTMSIKINEKIYIIFFNEKSDAIKMADYFDIWKDTRLFNQFDGFE